MSPIAEIRGLVDQFEGSTFELLRMMLFGWWERIGATRMSGIPKLIFAEAGNFPELARFYVAEVVRPGRTRSSRPSSSAASRAANSAQSIRTTPRS